MGRSFRRSNEESSNGEVRVGSRTRLGGTGPARRGFLVAAFPAGGHWPLRTRDKRGE